MKLRCDITGRQMNSHILVIHPGGLGDVLLALPALRALRAEHQGVDLVLMVSSGVGRLLEACSEIQRVIPLEGRALSLLLAEDSGTPSWLNEAVGMPELAVCWMTDRDGQLARSLRSLGVLQIIVRSPAPGVDSFQHQSDRFLAGLQSIARPLDEETPLCLPGRVLADGKKRIDRLFESGENTVALHPGSGSPHKCSDPALFAQAARSLSAVGYRPIVVGGPVDDNSVRAVESHLYGSVPSVTGLDLLSMAGLIAQVKLFVGHDSGLTHLAAALHRPTVALFGPTSVERWAPRGSHVRIVTGESCRCDGWDAVRACREKPCLRVAERHLLEACEVLLTHEFDDAIPPVHGGASPCPAR